MLSRLMTRREQLLILVAALSIIVGALSLMYYGEQSPAVPAEGVLESGTDTPRTASASPARATPSAPAASTSLTARPKIVSAAASEPEKVVVAAMGSVRRPGLYHMEPDARVGHLIDKAGGTATGADTEDIDLAAPLIDGTTLTVPEAPALERDRDTLRLSGYSRSSSYNPPQYLLSAKRGGMYTAAPSYAAPVSTAQSLINVNTASSEALETLPGIGPAMAARIIEHRQRSPFAGVDQLDDVRGIGVKTLAKLRPHVCVR